MSNNYIRLPKGKHAQLLSAEAWRIVSMCEGCRFKKEDIGREAGGRPFFQDRDVDFNISHSGALAAVSFVSGKNMRTSCDVELVRPRALARVIAKEAFTGPEWNYIESGGSEIDITRFYQIWTLKECFLKLKGLSVYDMYDSPSFICEGQSTGQFVFSAAVSSPLLFNLYELSGRERYILATALEGAEDYSPEIRWFSQESLACKSIVNIKAAVSPAETVRPKI